MMEDDCSVIKMIQEEENMTVKECYEVLGANYEDVMSRLRKEERAVKFLKMFLADESFASLAAAMEAGNMEDAFRAAHSLKGVSLNLSLANLYTPASRLSDRLKVQREDGAEVQAMFEDVKREYGRTVEMIGKM